MLAELGKALSEPEGYALLGKLHRVRLYENDETVREYITLLFAVFGDVSAYRDVLSIFPRRGNMLPLWWQERVRAYLRRRSQ